MRNIFSILKEIDKQRIEQLFMSITSGFLVSLYLIFTRNIIIPFRWNFFFDIMLVFLTYCIISYYIQNLRKYFLKDKVAITLFLFIGIISYMILKGVVF